MLQRRLRACLPMVFAFCLAATASTGATAALTCSGTLADCDGNAGNGCEVDLSSDSDNCGGCNLFCSFANISLRTCTSGVCTGTCSAGFGDCDGNKLTNGCETNLQTSLTHCGGCGQACSTNHIATPTCTSGSCGGACDPGFADCNADMLSDGCETAVSAESCDLVDNDCDGSIDETRLEVIAERRTVGAGSHPTTGTEPLAFSDVRIYDRSDESCAILTCGGVGPQQWECIVNSACPVVDQGSTNSMGHVTFEPPPGDYLIIGTDEVGRHVGTQVPHLCGGTAEKTLRQIVTANGRAHPAEASVRTGSMLLIIEPVCVEWTGSQELYPIVLESLGDWTVTTSVAPPEGFVADHDSLSAQVASTIAAVQFTITDVGSQWVPTQVQHVVTHGARKEIILSRIGVQLTESLAKAKGLDREGRPIEAGGNPKANAGVDPRLERPAEILGWIEPSAADATWTVKFKVNRSTNVRVAVVGDGGRLVRVLTSGRMEPGEQAVAWDARDAEGKSLGTGEYRLSLSSGLFSESALLIPDRSGRKR